MKALQLGFLALVYFALWGCNSTTPINSKTKRATADQTGQQKILVFTKTAGYRHEAIEKGVATFEAIGVEENIKVIHTEDAAIFNTPPLSQYDAIVFLNTTGDILDASQQQAFEAYITNGGRFLGGHAAADTEYDWPFYGELLGGYFESHPNNPNILEATLIKTANAHPATAHLESQFTRADEWYNYKSVRPSITPVLLLDESSYKGGNQGDYHPISWYTTFGKAKSFYIGGGHTKQAYDEPNFRQHIKAALMWCLE